MVVFDSQRSFKFTRSTDPFSQEQMCISRQVVCESCEKDPFTSIIVAARQATSIVQPARSPLNSYRNTPSHYSTSTSSPPSRMIRSILSIACKKLISPISTRIPSNSS